MPSVSIQGTLGVWHGDEVGLPHDLQVLLRVSREKLLQRLQARQALGAHFMPAALLDTQLAILEDSGVGMTAVSGVPCSDSAV